MKIDCIETLIDVGSFSQSKEWEIIRFDIINAISVIKWPIGSKTFTIYPQSGKKKGEGNGVVPIKQECMRQLANAGWKLEDRDIIIANKGRTGPIDATKKVGNSDFCVEWETEISHPVIVP